MDHFGSRLGWLWGVDVVWLGAQVGLSLDHPIEPTLTVGYAGLGIACIPEVECDGDGPFIAAGLNARIFKWGWSEWYVGASAGAMRWDGAWRRTLSGKGGVRFAFIDWIAPRLEVGREEFPFVGVNAAVSVGLDVSVPFGR